MCFDCHHFRPGTQPTFIVKDSVGRVLEVVPQDDSTAARRLEIDPAHVSSVDVVHGATVASVLGAGFENGIVIIVLNADGARSWVARHELCRR